MSSDPFRSSLSMLTAVQRRAVDWETGALLVLAGPGSGKTSVLTCRIARLLDGSRDRRFRILALTFTNKAAIVMNTRVADLVPGLEDRATIATFHGFCAQVLRQHGAHADIQPDFAIYSLPADRRAVLEDALQRSRGNNGMSREDVRYLPLIDRLKARLVAPDRAEAALSGANGLVSSDARHLACVYRQYEEELRRAGALDFNSLVFETYRLFKTYPVLARFYQRSYPYWLIDEFQDTNEAHYRLLRSMAVGGFRDLFVVADDDQAIFEWNGANVHQIEDVVHHFSCEVMQLSTNFRCPPAIVDTANRLATFNHSGMPKHPAVVPEHTSSHSHEEQIQYLEFESDREEVSHIANEIAQQAVEQRAATAVLARNRGLLNELHNEFRKRCVAAELVMRRDDFLSPEMRWLVACLKQIVRPLDTRNMAVLITSFERFANTGMDWGTLESRAAAEGITYLSIWTQSVRDAELPDSVSKLIDSISDLVAGSIKPVSAIAQVIKHFETDDPDDDLKEDLSAWHRIDREIRGGHGNLSLDRFLQELELRSKEPAPVPGTVTLTTIHGAKGREFDTVYLIGLVEDILPSYHSIKMEGDNGGTGIDEERRVCFVAITRARRRLILSRARRYRGWEKKPSRFLHEMGCLSKTGAGSDSQRVG